MPTVNGEPATGHEEPGRLYEEADKLLGFAERLQDRCEQYERRRWLLVGGGAGLTAAFICLGIYLIIRPFAEGWGYFWTVVPFLYGFGGTTFLRFMWAKVDQQLARERRALHSIVDMLRDLEKGIAERNNLSALERAEFRIRLSRLDIGPGGETRG